MPGGGRLSGSCSWRWGASWLAQVAGRPVTTIDEQAAVGRSFFGAIMNTEFILILIAVPVALAGSICGDKERGNLLPMLLTDLADAEIVLGKLAGRLVPLLGMVGCSLPVLALGALLGGIDPAALAGMLAIAVAMAVLVGAIALAFSTWGNADARGGSGDDGRRSDLAPGHADLVAARQPPGVAEAAAVGDRLRAVRPGLGPLSATGRGELARLRRLLRRGAGDRRCPDRAGGRPDAAGGGRRDGRPPGAPAGLGPGRPDGPPRPRPGGLV